MARKRKSTHKRKTTHHRRHRISGVANLDFTAIALVIGGAVAARILFNKLAASTNTTMQKLAPYSGVALGIVLPMVTKNPMLKQISTGMIAGGGVTLLGPTGLKVISGFENTVSGHRVGYPYAVLPYAKVAGIQQGENYVTKSNFSGSGKNQLNVISGINHSGDGAAM